MFLGQRLRINFVPRAFDLIKCPCGFSACRWFTLFVLVGPPREFYLERQLTQHCPGPRSYQIVCVYCIHASRLVEVLGDLSSTYCHLNFRSSMVFGYRIWSCRNTTCGPIPFLLIWVFAVVSVKKNGIILCESPRIGRWLYLHLWSHKKY
jgi:hypothetical protein